MIIPTPQQTIGSGNSPRFTAQGVAAPAPGPVQLQNLGQAASQAGKVIGDIASTLEIERTTAEAKGALTELFAYTDETSRSYYEMRGENAIGKSRSQAVSDIEGRLEALSQGLSTDLARGVFRQQADRHLVQIRGNIAGHEAKERRRYLADKTAGLQKQAAIMAIDTAIRGDVPMEVRRGSEIAGQLHDLTDREIQAQQGRLGPPTVRPLDDVEDDGPPQWKTYLNTALDEARQLGEINGEPDVVTDLRVLKQGTEIYQGAIEGFLNEGRTDEAKAFLEAADSDHIDPVTRSRLKASIAKAGEMDQAFKVANDLMTKPGFSDTIESDVQASRQDPVRAPSAAVSNAVAEINAMVRDGKMTPRVARGAIAQVQEQARLQRQVWEEQGERTLLEAEQFLERNRGVSVDSPAFPAGLRDQLIDHGVADSARRIASGLVAGERVTDPRALGAMYQLADSGMMSQMTRSELFTAFYPKLSSVHWNQMLSIWSKQNPDADEAPKSYWDAEDSLNKVLFDNGYISGLTKDGKPIPDPDEDDELEFMMQFLPEFQTRMNRMVTANGSQPTDEDKIRIASEIVTDAVNEGPAFLVPDEEESVDVGPRTVRIADIPGGFIPFARDRYRLSLVPDAAAPAVEKRLQDLGAFTDDADRDSIEAMWQGMRLGARNMPRIVLASEWVKSNTTPGSRWSAERFGDSRPAEIKDLVERETELEAALVGQGMSRDRARTEAAKIAETLRGLFQPQGGPSLSEPRAFDPDRARRPR